MQIDRQFGAVLFGHEQDFIDEPANHISRFASNLFIVQCRDEILDLLVIPGGHVGVEQHRGFLDALKKDFQLFETRLDPNGIVLENRSGHTLLDAADDLGLLALQLGLFLVKLANRGVVIVAHTIEMLRVLFAKFLAEIAVHQVRAERAKHCFFNRFTLHRQAVIARALVTRR